MYWVSVFTEAGIFAILALGLDVIWGWGGDFDLAFYAYLALGSYLTFVLTIGKPTLPVQYILGYHLPVILAVVVAMVVVVGLAAVIGAVPIAAGYGADGASRRPLGLVIVGGLVASQFITLYVTPVIYLYLERFQERVLDRTSFFRSGRVRRPAVGDDGLAALAPMPAPTAVGGTDGVGEVAEASPHGSAERETRDPRG